MNKRTTAPASFTFPSPNEDVQKAALARQAVLTKPPGSLGQLEELAVQIAAYQANNTPKARPCSTLLFAADHPVTVHGISPYPSEVTAAMVQNFQSGGAAASVLSRASQLPLHVIDAGVKGGAVDREIPGGDIRTEDAMSPQAFAQAVQLGVESAKKHATGNALSIFGEMGIGNTTPAAAVAAALMNLEDPAEMVGAGTGAAGSTLENKRIVVREAVKRVFTDATSTGGSKPSPSEILRRLGGREMAAIYGALRQVLAQRCVVLIDGFIVTAVAAVVLAEEPDLKAGMIFSHQSAEQGHRSLLQFLGGRPLLQLQMRLGEASGALTAYPLVERACALHNDMATFESANIPDAEAEEKK